MDDLKRYRAIIISDYGKGTVDDQLVRDVLASRLPIVVNACQGTCLDKYRDCHVVIRNRDGVDRVDCGRLGIGALIETDGSNGVTLYQADQEPRHVPAVAVDRVSDECGAGDVVTAMVAWYLARGFAPQDALLAAVRAAAVEIRHIGCQRVDLIDVYPSQIIECAEEISQWPRPLVIANGVFDLLHPGHVHLLRAARKCGRALLVLLNSDGSARRLKGQDRPVLNQHVRAGMLRDLPEVDGVMLFDEDTPVEIIKQLRPEVLVKGEKCSKPVPGAEFARRLYVVPELPNFSTTKLVGV
jgi:D-beta-D-heptose 7-phosphate kinase/D-beta-D-heptose 1-phosphate adenosyltransferase